MNKNKEENNCKKYILKKELSQTIITQNDKEPFKFLNLRYIFLENSNITFLNS